MLQTPRKKIQVTYKESGFSSVISTIILERWWQQSYFFKIIKENYFQSIILHPVKPFYHSRIKVFSDMKELKTFTFYASFLKKQMKSVLHQKMSKYLLRIQNVGQQHGRETTVSSRRTAKRFQDASCALDLQGNQSRLQQCDSETAW